jgi:hypothetical protein
LFPTLAHSRQQIVAHIGISRNREAN